jgi:hypothetical protein
LPKKRIFEGKKKVAECDKVNTKQMDLSLFFDLNRLIKKMMMGGCDRLDIHRPTGDRSVSSGWLLSDVCPATIFTARRNDAGERPHEKFNFPLLVTI